MVYATLYTTAFIKPANPGLVPVILTNTTGIKQTAIWYNFTLDTELYLFLRNMDKALKQHLMGEVEDIYVRACKEKYIGYRNLTCLELIDHLKANYYKITPIYLKLNTARMNAPQTINEPFDSIIKKIEMAVDFADAGKVPYTPEKVVTTEYDLIFTIGYFTDVCCWWNQNPAASKTWAESKIYFTEEHRFWQDTKPTSAGATYPYSNALMEVNIIEAKTIE